MLNFAGTYQLAVPLFSSVSNASNAVADKDQDACKASIESLAKEVKSGNEDAIELLINFASGTDHPDIRQLAEQSLIDLYSDPQVSDHTKLQIREQALAFYEVAKDANNAKKKDGSQFVPHEISPQILYLAGQQACSLDSAPTETISKINECLHGQIYKHNNGAHDPNLLVRGRFVSGDELINCRTQFSNLKPHTNCLDLNDEKSIKNEIEKMTAGLDGTGPATAFVNTGGHWVPLILQRASGGTGKVNCYVLDSHFQEGSRLSENIETKLTTALNDKMGKFHFIGAPMQENTPNACGPLAMRLLTDLNSHPDVHSPDFDIEAAIKKSVSNWFALDDNQKNAMVTAIRAQLLGATARAVNANE